MTAAGAVHRALGARPATLGAIVLAAASVLAACSGQRGNLVFAFNYGNVSWRVPKGAKLVLGKQTVAPQSLSIWSV